MILVTGATGTSGAEIVKQLSYDAVPVRIMVRDPARAMELTGPGVEVVQGDFARPDTLAAALEGVDRALLLSAVHPDQVQWQNSFIAAAKDAGVRQVVKFSALGAALDSPLTWGRWHAETERALEASGMAWTILQPSMFMQNILMFAPTIHAQGAFYAPMGDAKVGMVDVRDIATVAVRTLTERGHEGQRYAITGPEALSFHEVAARLAHVLGKPVKYVPVDPATARQGMQGAGMPAFLIDGLLELYAYWAAGHGELTTPVVSDVARKQPFTFDEFARDYAAYFANVHAPAHG